MTQEIHFKEYLHHLWKRKNVVGIFLVSVVLLSALFTLRQQSVYRAVAVIEIGAETPDVFYTDVVNVSPYAWWSMLKYYETQYQVLRSRSLMEKVADRVIAQKLLPGSKESITAQLVGGISIEADDKSRLVRLHFDDIDPNRAAKLVNTVAEVYVDDNLAQKLQGITQAIDWLTARLQDIRKEKRVQEEELQKFKEENLIVSVGDRENIAKTNLIALADTLNRIKSQRIEYEAQYSKLNELVKQSKKVEDLLGVVSNELLISLKQTLARLESEKSSLSHRYLEKHPTMIRLTNEIASVEKSIRTEIENEVGRLKTKYLLAQAQEKEIDKALEAQKLEALKLEGVNRKVTDIQVVTNTNQQLFESIQKKLKEVDLSSLLRSNNIRIVDRALPGGKIRPNVGRSLLLAFLIGLLGGIALAFLMEYMDDTLKIQEDVERYLDIPILGIIPHNRMTTNGHGIDKPIEFVPADDPTSVVSEFFRTLRTNVLFLTAAKGKKKILIVSTGPSEGKTSIAINLAITFAQIGQKTIIVELDLRRPRIHTKFNAPERTGITNILVGDGRLNDVIRTSEIPNLDYILSGAVPPNPSELLASQGLKDILDELAKRYDRIIIDSSPIAPVTDAVVVSQSVDGVVVVVRSGKTHRKAARLAVAQLKSVKAEILGAVLNDVDIEKSTYGNYQYYKYGYSSYGEGLPKKERDEPELPEASA